ncbi:hypothetical protein [Leifsonia sp. Leaf264]|uniref:hypothetical protein n=1 Tax=Leifsonia sp. Leaf264 TaxID=1736314 RepID=UPI000AE2FE49|nr:hypothetical protein [Leifsonia sp. Leaf264]
MTDAVTRLGSSALNGLLGLWVDGRRRLHEDQRLQRRNAADDLLSWIPEMRELLVRLESEQDPDVWRALMAKTYGSVRGTTDLTPLGWRHLRHSLFDAIGSGAGAVVWIDLDPEAADGELTYDHLWTMNAVEYLDHLQSVVRRWKKAYRQKDAARVVLLSYNDWLLRPSF